MTPHTYSRERLAELLAVAPEQDLVAQPTCAWPTVRH